MTKWCCIVAIALLVAGCGGGGGPSPPDRATGPPPPVEPEPVEFVNSVLFSDLLFSGPGYTNERVEHIECTSDLSQCMATFRGVDLAFPAAPTAEGEAGTTYTSLGAWTHMHPVVVEVSAEGLAGRLAAVGGGTSATSLPALLGSATWQGELFALDTDNRLVRGGATLTIDDLATPVVDVELTPEGHAAMTWVDLPVTGGGFSARDSASDYLRGAFYGPAAEEVGGVFERNRLLGAFGAAR